MMSVFILFLYSGLNINTGFTFSYYFVPYDYYGEMQELKVVPKGLNIGFSFEKKNIGFRINSGFIKGGFKDYFYTIGGVFDSYTSETDFKEIWGEISILPYLSLKELDFYLGLGVSFSLINYYFERIDFIGDSITDAISIKYYGNLLVFPLTLGIEKEIFKRVKLFGETYAIAYGLLNLRWKENQRKREKDYLISGGYPFYFYEEGKLGKIILGVKYEW